MTARVAVAGAGVVGLAVALALSRRGAEVEIYDDFLNPSASAVAAGMLAPSFESAFDPDGVGYPALSRALGLWPSLAEQVGSSQALVRSGGLYVARDEARLWEVQTRLNRIGAKVDRLSAKEARALQPGLAQDVAGAVFVHDEARVTPEPMLWSLRDALQRAGGRVVPERLMRLDAAGAVVLAAGFGSAAFAEAAPELAALEPIKGQLINFPGDAVRGGPTVRGDGIYVAPQTGCVVAGATMETGRSDLELDAPTLQGLVARAAALFPVLGRARSIGRVGVRAATPDGRPLAGASSRPGLFLATGMRRNGWLLAPLVAEVVACAVFGEPPPPEAAAFDPRRFS